ncbi:MAG: flippase-like domain-containing protein [Phycisphaerales bacterium]|nr:flippase-like domain-containing protein [Phycisphaerales bacterium]
MSTPEPQPTDLKRRWARAIIPVVGFLLSLGAMAWAIRSALSPENRAQLDHLRDASPVQLLTMMSLAAVSVAFNGIIFWATIRPVQRIRITDVISTNAIATFLAYLPFKLSVIVRIAIHNRRDGVPILTIGAWFAAVGALMLLTLGPITGASIWLKDTSTLWWTLVIVGVTLSTFSGSWAARFFSGEHGLARLKRMPIPDRIVESEAGVKIRSAFDMVGDLRAAFTANLFRVLDVLAFAGRFIVAAQILNLPISASDALLLGGTYFLIGVFSPFGQIGVREAGTIGLASLVGISAEAAGTDSGSSPIALAVVFVTAVEGAVNLVCAGFGIAWLRAGRLLRSSTSEAYDSDA